MVDPFQVTRKALVLFFLGFPIIVAALTGFLSLGLGNLGMFFLFLGHALAVPLGTGILHLFTQFMPGSKMHASDVGQLVPSVPYTSPTFNVYPSYWVAHTVFFFAYLFANALDVYLMPPISDSPADEWRVENRKARTSMMMLVTCFMLLFMLALRYIITNTENIMGILLGFGVFGAVGGGWYLLAKQAGARRGDVFGIVQQMVPIVENTNITMCTPAPA